MIEIAASGITLRTNRYLHHKKQVVSTKSLVTEAGDCCWCSCETEIPAFADLTAEEDKYKNDVFSWILKVPDGCTVTATLTNLETLTEYVISDNTYGDLYDVGDLKDNVWGFIIKWYNVAGLIGFGTYTLTISVSNATPTEIFNKTYAKFRVLPYSCQAAHGTVRIETINTGYIEGGFDYRDIIISPAYPSVVRGVKGWLQQIRYWGRLDITAMPTQIDNIYDNYRNLTQVQTQIQNEWNLRLEFIKSDISKQIIYDNLLADYILVSDYNANSVDTYRDVKLSLISVENVQNFKNRSRQIEIKLADYKQNNLKRFY